MQDIPRNPTHLRDGRGAHGWPAYRSVGFGAAAFIAGSGILYVMPAYLETVADALHLSATDIGFLSAVEIFAIGISSVAVGFTLSHVPWSRWLLPCALIAAVGDFSVGLMPNFASLLGSRFVVGLLAEGPLFAIGCLALARSKNPDRGFGIALSLVAILSAAAMSIHWAGLWPLASGGELLFIAGVSAILAAVLPFMPMSIEPLPALIAHGISGKRYGAADLLVAQALWYGAPGLFWAFAEKAATLMGFRENVVARALSVASILGLAGSILPTFIADRWGRLKPIGVATAGLCGSVIAFQYLPSTAMLFLGLCGVTIFWNVAAVYEPALIASADQTGRAAAFVPVSQLAGQALGPALAGIAIDRAGIGVLSIGVSGFSLLGCASFVWFSARQARRRS